MWVINETTGKILQVNRACINTYGYSEAEFLRMSIRQLTPEKLEDIEENEETDIFFRGNQQHIRKSGELIDVITSSIPIQINGENNLLLIAIDVTEKNQYEQRLAKAAINAQEKERYEIGGELHDNICQILAGSMVCLEMMKESIPETARQTFDQTYKYINLATDEIRNLSHRLAPAFFDQESLEDTLIGLLEAFNLEKKYKITLKINKDISKQAMNNELHLNLYRILQEQLRNIMKHADASRILIDIGLNKQNLLQMKIADNGKGFDVRYARRGIGLANMNRRVQLFSGSLKISSAPGKGCKILVTVPLSIT